jgi:hypothetical protein
MSDQVEMPHYQSHKKVWALKIGAGRVDNRRGQRRRNRTGKAATS